MLIKFDTYLIERLIEVKKEESKEENQYTATIVTENGAIKIPFSKKSWIESEDMSEVVPSWLKESLIQGPIVTMSRSEYDSLPIEVQKYSQMLLDK